MERFGSRCAVLFYLFCVFLTTIAEEPYNRNQQSIHTVSPVNDQQKQSAWTSSSPSRTKRNTLSYEENFRAPTLEREQLESLMGSVQELPWAIVTFSEGKRHDFVPRLGRESGEESDVETLHDANLNRELMNQRSPPFAPRLGRRTSNTYYFDPRLGKRNYNSQKQLL